MSLRPQSLELVPAETIRVARAAFSKGTLCMRLRDELGSLFQDAAFASLYSHTGQPGLSPWRLALVSVLQFAEGLSDRQAADAVRSRIDWKYALALDLTDPGFDSSILSEFRARLVAKQGDAVLFDGILRRLIEAGLLRPHGRYRTDSTHVLAAVRTLNRVELVGETLRAALDDLAVEAPDWLRPVIDVDWFDRYGRRVEDYRLPKSQAARRTLAEQIGSDGHRLLEAAYAPTAPARLRDLPAVRGLRRCWVEQFHVTEGKVRWRESADLPPAGLRVDTPYDPDTRYATKGTKGWHGYKVHLTETCDDGCPHIIVHVATTPATVPDTNLTVPIHHALEDRGLLPHRHYLDAGYVDAGIRVRLKRDFQVDPVSPVRPDSNWQSNLDGGYGIEAFTVDWETRTARCPQGQVSQSAREDEDRWGNGTVRFLFSQTACRTCRARSLCTHSVTAARCLTVRREPEHEAILQARREQTTLSWQADYGRRAGIEGTISQAVRSFDLRKCRYVGLAKARLQGKPFPPRP
jgi:transposase